ncbi:MAG: FIG00481327: hypothetical protein, partial [uncultured Acetobacteraceae bacterium]
DRGGDAAGGRAEGDRAPHPAQRRADPGRQSRHRPAQPRGHQHRDPQPRPGGHGRAGAGPRLRPDRILLRQVPVLASGAAVRHRLPPAGAPGRVPRPVALHRGARSGRVGRGLLGGRRRRLGARPRLRLDPGGGGFGRALRDLDLLHGDGDAGRAAPFVRPLRPAGAARRPGRRGALGRGGGRGGARRRPARVSGRLVRRGGARRAGADRRRLDGAAAARPARARRGKRGAAGAGRGGAPRHLGLRVVHQPDDHALARLHPRRHALRRLRAGAGRGGAVRLGAAGRRSGAEAQPFPDARPLPRAGAAGGGGRPRRPARGAAPEPLVFGRGRAGPARGAGGAGRAAAPAHRRRSGGAGLGRDAAARLRRLHRLRGLHAGAAPGFGGAARLGAPAPLPGDARLRPLGPVRPARPGARRGGGGGGVLGLAPAGRTGLGRAAVVARAPQRRGHPAL